MGHEYIYCHRALRQLAARLSDSGFPVLRFDYYGCGDSSGYAEEGEISQWLQDISTAIAVARNRSGIARTCLVGIRLGAALSFLAAAHRDDVDSIALWDPVVIGKTYLEGLYSLQKEALRCHPKPIRNRSTICMEIIGFPLPRALRAELEALNLLAIVPKPSTKILTIHSSQSSDGTALKDHFGNHRVPFEFCELHAPNIWLPTVDGSLLVPNQVLQSIVSWTSRTQA